MPNPPPLTQFLCWPTLRKVKILPCSGAALTALGLGDQKKRSMLHNPILCSRRFLQGCKEVLRSLFSPMLWWSQVLWHHQDQCIAPSPAFDVRMTRDSPLSKHKWVEESIISSPLTTNVWDFSPLTTYIRGLFPTDHQCNGALPYWPPMYGGSSSLTLNARSTSLLTTNLRRGSSTLITNIRGLFPTDHHYKGVFLHKTPKKIESFSTDHKYIGPFSTNHQYKEHYSTNHQCMKVLPHWPPMWRTLFNIREFFPTDHHYQGALLHRPPIKGFPLVIGLRKVTLT